MNRIQKMSWLVVVCAGTGFFISVVVVTIMAVKVGFPKAFAGFAFLSLAGFGGLGPLIFKKDPGAVQSDERDRVIQLHAAKAGFGASYVVFGCLAMGIWIYQGPDKLINVNTLPQIWIAAFITAFFVQALTTLILYGKDNKLSEEGAA